MKKALIIIVIVAVLGAFWLRNQVKKAVDNLGYGIASGVKLSGLTFGESTISIPIWINNESSIGMMVSNLDLNLFVNNVYAGKASFRQVYQIVPKGKSIIPVSFKLDNVSAMQVLINVNQYLGTSNWRDKINISVRGKCRAEVGPIYIESVPISMDGTYKYWMG